MSKQRRKRLNRTKHIRSHRSLIRNGVEQLESRVLPGGFLDLLAGAALVSNLDLLPAEQFIPEEIEAESDAITLRERPANALLQTGLSPSDVELEPREGRVKLTPATEDRDLAPVSRATTNLLVSASFVDAFFTSNQFVDTRLPVSLAPHLPLSRLPVAPSVPQSANSAAVSAAAPAKATTSPEPNCRKPMLPVLGLPNLHFQLG